MKAIRIVFGLMGLLWLVGTFVFGAGMTWLSHNPDDAAAMAVGVASVDPDAGLFEQKAQFDAGAATGREVMQLQAEASKTRARERALEASRESYGDGWGDDAVSGDWGD